LKDSPVFTTLNLDTNLPFILGLPAGLLIGFSIAVVLQGYSSICPIILPTFTNSFIKKIRFSSCARLRICLLINWLLKHLGDNYEMNSDLYDKIFDSMLERLEDKVPEIRAQAVTALHRLQVFGDMFTYFQALQL
jgi:hypothetical protein